MTLVETNTGLMLHGLTLLFNSQQNGGIIAALLHRLISEGCKVELQLKNGALRVVDVRIPQWDMIGDFSCRHKQTGESTLKAVGVKFDPNKWDSGTFKDCRVPGEVFQRMWGLQSEFTWSLRPDPEQHKRFQECSQILNELMRLQDAR
jgi:hypothetical protein